MHLPYAESLSHGCTPDRRSIYRRKISPNFFFSRSRALQKKKATPRLDVQLSERLASLNVMASTLKSLIHHSTMVLRDLRGLSTWPLLYGETQVSM